MAKDKKAKVMTTVECIDNSGDASDALVVGQQYEVCCHIGKFYYFGDCPHFGWSQERFKEVA